MSATPIPRTLAIILYGDLQVSVIDELPGGRIPIKNCVVGEEYRPKAYAFMENRLPRAGRFTVSVPWWRKAKPQIWKMSRTIQKS